MSESKTLWLMRHGSLPDSYKGQLVGSSEAPLSERGQAEARATAGLVAKFGEFSDILCSPQLRAWQTAELALAPEQLAHLEIVPELREVDFGELEGLTCSEVAERHPDAYAAWGSDAPDFAFPGGESMASLAARMTAVKGRVQAAAGNVLAITHGGPALELLCLFLGLPRSKRLAFKLDRGALCRIDVFPNGLGVLAALNLKPEESWLKSS